MINAVDNYNTMLQACQYAELFNFDAGDLVQLCRYAKNQLAWTNADLAERSEVSKGTIDRMFSTKEYTTDVRYETMRLLLKALLGGLKEAGFAPAPSRAAAFAQLDQFEQLQEFKANQQKLLTYIEAETHAKEVEVKAKNEELDIMRGEVKALDEEIDIMREEIKALDEERREHANDRRVMHRYIAGLSVAAGLCLLTLIAVIAIGLASPAPGILF